MMKVKMIGNKKALSELIMIAFVFIFLLVSLFVTFWLIDQMKFSWKINKEIQGQNATCYLERGLFKIPIAKVCFYNQTMLIEKRQLGPNLITKIKEIPQEIRNG